MQNSCPLFVSLLLALPLLLASHEAAAQENTVAGLARYDGTLDVAAEIGYLSPNGGLLGLEGQYNISSNRAVSLGVGTVFAQERIILPNSVGMAYKFRATWDHWNIAVAPAATGISFGKQDTGEWDYAAMVGAYVQGEWRADGSGGFLRASVGGNLVIATSDETLSPILPVISLAGGVTF